ncbi:MAG TPA: histidine triad nucleotide-binding protein [Candidatus Parcubacteria bacterium]|jgi:histidine triad (HIT) family protein|nr:histidine triad nucleotide-binding protein [Parcubacteria group bacterium]HJN62233.1 histidine triad nucleotide-binding protein [Candidatus Parcubacteria bacterium]|tara:strand:- start:3619 stop:3948 length:330 start_codon:yes stop_codon:yes gene_type:complete
MDDCLFCQITNKKEPANILYEDDEIIAFKDIYPKAPIHVLVVPKKHILSVDHLKEEDKGLIGELFLVAKKLAKDQKISESGYKLLFNVGEGGGQVIGHLHLHLLGGWKK